MNRLPKFALLVLACVGFSQSSVATLLEDADNFSTNTFAKELKRQYIFVVDEGQRMGTPTKKPKVGYDWIKLHKKFVDSSGPVEETGWLAGTQSKIKQWWSERGWTRWETTRYAMEALSDYLLHADPDLQIPVYAYKKDQFRPLGILKQPEDVKTIMKQGSFSGEECRLGPVLTGVVAQHHRKFYKRTTVLVFTNGDINDKINLKTILEQQACGLRKPLELAYVFLKTSADPTLDLLFRFLGKQIGGTISIKSRKINAVFKADGPYKVIRV